MLHVLVGSSNMTTMVVVVVVLMVVVVVVMVMVVAVLAICLRPVRDASPLLRLSVGVVATGCSSNTTTTTITNDAENSPLPPSQWVDQFPHAEPLNVRQQVVPIIVKLCFVVEQCQP
ncbi:hypothetical protein M0802_003806 [Mischocyttarus mexicanus]|nr:hypothetical protein M0802_003806 [Mischocyttarus mexicanus]